MHRLCVCIILRGDEVLFAHTHQQHLSRFDTIAKHIDMYKCTNTLCKYNNNTHFGWKRIRRKKIACRCDWWWWCRCWWWRWWCYCLPKFNCVLFIVSLILLPNQHTLYLHHTHSVRSNTASFCMCARVMDLIWLVVSVRVVSANPDPSLSLYVCMCVCKVRVLFKVKCVAQNIYMLTEAQVKRMYRKQSTEESTSNTHTIRTYGARLFVWVCMFIHKQILMLQIWSEFNTWPHTEIENVRVRNVNY